MAARPWGGGWRRAHGGGRAPATAQCARSAARRRRRATAAAAAAAATAGVRLWPGCRGGSTADFCLTRSCSASVGPWPASTAATSGDAAAIDPIRLRGFFFRAGGGGGRRTTASWQPMKTGSPLSPSCTKSAVRRTSLSRPTSSQCAMIAPTDSSSEALSALATERSANAGAAGPAGAAEYCGDGAASVPLVPAWRLHRRAGSVGGGGTEVAQLRVLERVARRCVQARLHAQPRIRADARRHVLLQREHAVEEAAAALRLEQPETSSSLSIRARPPAPCAAAGWTAARAARRRRRGYCADRSAAGAP